MFEPTFERMERGELAQLQLERLQATLNRVSRNVPFYRRMFERENVDPDAFRGVDDIRRIPFTTKDDLRAAYPYGMFAVPLREVVRLQASSGTTGKPLVMGYTRNDLARWGRLTARALAAAGVTRDDLVQVAFGYGLFTGGHGFQNGAETLGASVIPSGSGGSRRQVHIMQDYRTTTLCCTPSYALHLADTMRELGVNVNALSLRRGVFGAETWSEAMRGQIEERLKLTALDTYGISEVMGPGIASECLEQDGLHLAEDHFLAEVVDPKTGEPVAAGETGELVLTTLTKEAFPLIRYRTGDLTRLLPGPCPCGRTLTRMGRVLGRSDDMLIIRGINVFPSQVEQILCEVEGAEPHYQIVLERGADHLDRASVLIEASDVLLVDRIREAQDVVARTEARLAAELGVAMRVKLVERKSLARSEGKAVRVLDKRSM